MACCLTAPSHYLNQCWLIIRGVLWHTSESSFAGIAQGIDSGYEFEKDILKNIFKSPRGQWVNPPHVSTSPWNTKPSHLWQVIKQNDGFGVHNSLRLFNTLISDNAIRSTYGRNSTNLTYSWKVEERHLHYGDITAWVWPTFWSVVFAHYQFESGRYLNVWVPFNW